MKLRFAFAALNAFDTVPDLRNLPKKGILSPDIVQPSSGCSLYGPLKELVDKCLIRLGLLGR